jgi:signal transduction histidine kinase
VVACAGAWVLAVAVTAGGTQDAPALAAAVQASVVGCPLLVGLAEWSSGSRVPRLLVGAGLGLAIVSLSAAELPALYSIGRVAIWFLVPGVTYLLLSFPAGRLDGRRDVALFAATLAVAGTLYLPMLPFVTDFPTPVPWGSCTADCPGNAFAVVARQPAVINDVHRPLREVMTIALLVAVTAVLARRTTTARPVLRAALTPVFAAASANTLSFVAYLTMRRAGASENVVLALGTMYVLSFPTLALAFAGGRVLRTLQAARSLERLAHALRSPETQEVDPVLAEALRDPSARLVVPADASAPAQGSLPAHGTGVTPIRVEGRQAAVIVHDALLDDDPELLRAAGEIALLKVDHDRLVRRLTQSLDELAHSRARLVATSDRERRRIERDLHDGAQQHLLAVRIRLSLLEDRLAERAPEDADEVRELGAQVEDALEQIRSVARGIYPPLLSEHGLEVALRAAARGSPLPVTVDVHQSLRYPSALESTIYFTCLEALQNAIKHAADATVVRILVREDGDQVHFEIDDDAPDAGVLTDGGSGLANMRDRVAAVGGTIRLTSTPGHGTRVAGAVPLPATEESPDRDRPGPPRQGTAAQPSLAARRPAPPRG